MAEKRKQAGVRGRDASPPEQREVGEGERLFELAHRGRCDGGHDWQRFGVGRGLRLVACGICGVLKPGQMVPHWHQSASVGQAEESGADSSELMVSDDSLEA